MTKAWDTWTITFTGAVAGLMAGLGHILAGRLNAIGEGPILLGQLILYIAGAAAIFGAAAILRNRIALRNKP